MSKPQNNTEFLTDLMEYSKSGPIMQVFIIDALAKQAKRIAETPLEELVKAFGNFPFVSPEAWQATAKELHQKLQERGCA